MLRRLAAEVRGSGRDSGLMVGLQKQTTQYCNQKNIENEREIWS